MNTAATYKIFCKYKLYERTKELEEVKILQNLQAEFSKDEKLLTLIQL